MEKTVLIRSDDQEVSCRLFSQDVAVIFNGDGEFLLSFPEDVIEFELGELQIIGKDNDNSKVEWSFEHGIVAKIYRPVNDTWELMARLEKL